jgi:hypothetical protein
MLRKNYVNKLSSSAHVVDLSLIKRSLLQKSLQTKADHISRTTVAFKRVSVVQGRNQQPSFGVLKPQSGIREENLSFDRTSNV